MSADIAPASDVRAEQVPSEPLILLFWRYLRFGLMAWGGPVAQIAMIRQELVEEKNWVSRERFNRTLAVYQALPGPEAHELCVHYGMVSRGRWGGVLAGLAFMLPGFLLMFALSALYVQFGLASPLAVAMLTGFRPAVVALVARAVHRLSSHALHDRFLAGVAICAALATAFGAPFFLALPLSGIAYVLCRRGRVGIAASLAVIVIGVAAGVYAANVFSSHSAVPFASSTPEGASPSLLRLFGSGLKAGSLTFGGAYTVIPYLQADAVGNGGWMANEQFLDGIALGGVLPAPLIIFATFVGYLGGGPVGALVVTFAIFLPAFGFTLLGFKWLQRAIANPWFHNFLDGVTAGVIGLIAVTAVLLFAAAVRAPFQYVVFGASILLLYSWKAKASVPVAVLGSGVLGILFEWAR